MTQPAQSRQKAEVAVVGLAVMGANLALNMAESGIRVAVYNRTPSVTHELMQRDGTAAGLHPAETLGELVDSLSRPRRLLLMVKAGAAVDRVIADLLPHLDKGDIVIDGGNSLYTDTERRYHQLKADGIHFLGVGISGGESGARHGPSLMPGGDAAAWPEVQPILAPIAAVAPDGVPCCDWLGEGGAGHYVKMVHNGIEYGDMQLIAEAYDLMRRGMDMHPQEIGDVFEEWNQGRLQSYLVEITAGILKATEGRRPLIDYILDVAGQKGTGRWTVMSSMDLTEPTVLVAEAVYARMVSADPDSRARLSSIFPSPLSPLEGVAISDIESALYASKVISYVQGFRLLSTASQEHSWGLDLGLVARLWRAGCIIRAAFLDDLATAYSESSSPTDLTAWEFFADALNSAEPSWRGVVSGAALSGIPAPAYSTALAYFDGMRSVQLPANLVQAQRDYFGAHTFERIDRPRGDFFHHEWA